MMKLTILLVVLLAAIVIWARSSEAGHITGAGISTLHVRSFEMWDDLGFGFTFGRYESGLPDCKSDPEFGHFFECGWNGYFHVDTVTIPLLNETGIEAVYRFDGPAYDRNGVAIQGTEDDRVIITARIGVAFTGLSFPENSFHILQILIEGSSLEFANGVPIESMSFDFTRSDAQQIGEGNLLFTPEDLDFFLGFFQGSPFPSTMMIDDLFQISYRQEYEFRELRQIFNIPVPEPGFSMMLIFGTVSLLFLKR